MSKELSLITDYLESLEWNYNIDEEKEIVRLGVATQTCKLDCIIHHLPEQNFILFFSILPILVPQNKRTEIAEYITRANYGLNAGNLEMDYEDGEIRYRTYANTDDNSLNVEIAKHIIHTNIQTMDRYASGIMNIIYGNMSPKEAVDMAENSEDDDDDDEASRFLKDLLN